MSPAAMEISPASKLFARELWISLASLLRSHVAMRAIAQPSADWQVIASSDASVKIEGCGRTLRITSPDDSGAGTVAFNSGGQMDAEGSTAFFFTEDGRISFLVSGATLNQKGMEMEAAVEYVLDRVCP